MMSRFFSALSYIIFPRRCALCGEVTQIDSRLCEKCQKAPQIKGEICLKCGMSVDDCRCKAKDKKLPFDGVAAPFYYESSVAAGVHRFKYGGFTELSKEMSRLMSETVSSRFGDIHFDGVTFIPLDKTKLKKRGYNQAELLAAGISEIIGVPLTETLVKIRKTENQRGSSAKQRRVNLFGAFDIAENVQISGKTLLLVDDVKTTGSTFSECCEVLKAYGADKIYCISLCITKKH